jgi:DNA-binding transcriptional ArsR family regulator
MAPRPQKITEEELETQPEWDFEPDIQSGIVIRDEFSTTLPNYLMHAGAWLAEAGGRPPSVITMLVYMWMTDKVTKCEDIGSVIYGFVLGGRPIEFNILAENIGVSWRTIQSAVKYLVEVKLIERERVSKMRQYRYYVPNCRKTFNGKQPDGTIRMGGKTYHRTKPAETTSITDEDELS